MRSGEFIVEYPELTCSHSENQRMIALDLTAGIASKHNKIKKMTRSMNQWKDVAIRTRMAKKSTERESGPKFKTAYTTMCRAKFCPVREITVELAIGTSFYSPLLMSWSSFLMSCTRGRACCVGPRKHNTQPFWMALQVLMLRIGAKFSLEFLH